jgi:hypothetical protein
MKLRGLFVLSLAMGGLGCASASNRPATEPVLTGTDGTCIRRMIDAQAAVGARNDGALYPGHFSGERLNSLGEKKLGLMARGGDGTEALKVYLAGGTDSAPRRDAVTEYLKQLGLAESQIALEAGENPLTGVPARRGLADLSKTDTSPPSTDGQQGAAAGNNGSWVSPSPGAMAKEAVSAASGVK